MRAHGIEWVTPDWPTKPAVRAGTTLRRGGVSSGPYTSLNLASHAGDREEHVAENRRRLRSALGLPAEPLWLAQVHGITVARHDTGPDIPPADAAVAFAPGQVCAVLTADCLPVVFVDRDATRVGVAHAGWRGLADGVLEATIKALEVPPAYLLAWLGPAISQREFEVGAEVRSAFLARAPQSASAFTTNAQGRFQADLYALARMRLARAGVKSVFGGGWCTVREADRFYSFRRDGKTGRMATLAWLVGNP
jgi:polyphenol oxidase